MKKSTKFIISSLYCFAYILIIFLTLKIVTTVTIAVLSLFETQENTESMIIALISVAIIFFLSSNKMYSYFQIKLAKWWETAKTGKISGLVLVLINANDLWCALPKRTLLFLAYLLLSVLDKFGCNIFSADIMLVSIFIIGIDRVISNWEKEKPKLKNLGSKIFSTNNDNIADSIINNKD